MSTKFIALDQWVEDVIVDPLSKEPLTIDNDRKFLLSPYGRKYPIVNGVFDLRLLNNDTTKDQKLWKAGQREFEHWCEKLSMQDQAQDYFAEIETVREVYAAMPIEGTCIDVGGHQGRLRSFLSPEQRYITCDPFLNVFGDLDRQPNLVGAYPFLLSPVNFVCCDAEFLPFSSSFAQTVHMRSVIDHFFNPELALNEAYRILKPDGTLMVGLFVEGGKHGKQNLKSQAKEFIKKMLITAGLEKFKDHHVWHPTFNELLELIAKCGFDVEKVHWQKGFSEAVCYVSARKQLGLTKHHNA